MQRRTQRTFDTWFLSLATSVSLAVCVPAAATAQEAERADGSDDTTRLRSETFAGLKLRSIGPALMSGRIADIAVDPEDQSTWYVGVGSGGVWKTTNAGTTWTPIFDDQGSYSIGCVAVDPNRPQTVWVGTGENVGGRHVGYGDGVYKSLDGGQTWTNVGLTESEHIGSIVVDPRDSDVVFVAAQGPLWSAGTERGVYRSTDGGATWKRVLGGADHTGVNEVVMDPRDPDVLYAATHQRHRTVAALIDGGPASGIHKSTDGGATWRELKRGLPEDDMGRIGLAVSPHDPDVVYATIELAGREGGFWRSEDGGESWEKRSDYHSGGTGPHYYQEIFACPHRFDRVYQMDVRLHVTEDGGKTFERVGEEHKHGDNHALAFDPDDPDYLLNGCDGGVYESFDRGATWKFVANLPVTQFYKVAVDYDEPFYNLYGGTQDNNTQGGPVRTMNVNGIRNSDWFITVFADGHQPAVDPTDPNVVYSEWQQGNPVRYDRTTGEIVYIQPQPDPGDPPERWNWDTPILISPHDHKRLYYASQRVWRSDDRGDSWRPVSSDLSRGQERLRMPMMGRVWSVDAVWDLRAMSSYANVTSLSESPLVEGLLYAGTDDGLVQVSENGGQTWRRIDRVADVPELSFVNDVKADLHDPDTVFVVLDNHKAGDFAPYVVKSTDRGRTWKSIRGDLPDRHLVWRLVQDHEKPELLFVGTEFGVFFTVDGGEHWVELTGDVPNIPFRDLAIQKRENDLVAATFGRGFIVLDDYSALRHVSEAVLQREAELFPVRDALWYVEQRPLGRPDKATQGAAFFTAPNPPFGAVFTYHLSDGLKTRREARREREKEIAEAGGDTPPPAFEELEREDREAVPVIVLTVHDAAGEVVRHVTGPVGKGFHRVAWDLRYPAVEAWRPAGEAEQGRFGDAGWLAPPGAYTVTLHKRVDGVTTQLGEPREFRVKRATTPHLPAADPAETAAFLTEVADLQRAVSGAVAVVGETQQRLEAIAAVLDRSTIPVAGLTENVRALTDRLWALRKALTGESPASRLGEPVAPSIQRRLEVVTTGNRFSTYGPTPTHRRSHEIAAREMAQAREELDGLLDDLTALERRLEAEGLPWTPGRRVPGSR